jgi:hypothetical protein
MNKILLTGWLHSLGIGADGAGATVAGGVLASAEPDLAPRRCDQRHLLVARGAVAEAMARELRPHDLVELEGELVYRLPAVGGRGARRAAVRVTAFRRLLRPLAPAGGPTPRLPRLDGEAHPGGTARVGGGGAIEGAQSGAGTGGAGDGVPTGEAQRGGGTTGAAGGGAAGGAQRGSRTAGAGGGVGAGTVQWAAGAAGVRGGGAAGTAQRDAGTAGAELGRGAQGGSGAAAPPSAAAAWIERFSGVRGAGWTLLYSGSEAAARAFFAYHKARLYCGALRLVGADGSLLDAALTPPPAALQGALGRPA